MPRLYTDFYATKQELPPSVLRVLDEEAIPAIWTDGEGGEEHRYEIHEIHGLRDALAKAFPEVDFGEVELLVVWE